MPAGNSHGSIAGTKGDSRQPRPSVRTTSARFVFPGMMKLASRPVISCPPIGLRESGGTKPMQPDSKTAAAAVAIHAMGSDFMITGR